MLGGGYLIEILLLRSSCLLPGAHLRIYRPWHPPSVSSSEKQREHFIDTANPGIERLFVEKIATVSLEESPVRNGTPYAPERQKPFEYGCLRADSLITITKRQQPRSIVCEQQPCCCRKGCYIRSLRSRYEQFQCRSPCNDCAWRKQQ